MWAKAALAPLLLAQGAWVRRTALRLPEAAGPRIGTTDAVGVRERQLALWVVGDSSAAGVGVAHQEEALALPLAQRLAAALGARVAWRLQATSGHAAADALAAWRAAAPADGCPQTADAPTVLVTVLGVNDVLSQTPVPRWLAALDALHDAVGATLTLHSAVPPMGRFALLPQPLRAVLGRDALRLDAALASHVRGQAGRLHVPLPALPGPAADWLATDGFHPSAAGYRAWTAHVASAIIAACPRLTPH